jgi:hypothetical protein
VVRVERIGKSRDRTLWEKSSQKEEERNKNRGTHERKRGERRKNKMKETFEIKKIWQGMKKCKKI